MTIISSEEKYQHHKSDRDNISAKLTDFDKQFESTIRPQNFDEYIGQSLLKETLGISISAAKKRQEPVDHLLLYGPPGLGKTTLAGIIANEMDVKIRITSAPSLERPRDIVGILMTLQKGEVLFIDEIHRLNKVAEEILYPAMEDFSIDKTIGKGQTAKTFRVPIPRFTLIGATTKAGDLSSPLRDRFGITYRMEFYTIEDLLLIVKRTADILNVKVTEDGARAIAERARGTPRIANRLLKRARDFACVKSDGTITAEISIKAMELFNIDSYGLDTTDRNLLKLIIEKYNGGPVGIETISAALGEDIRTIEDIYEPFLLQSGLIARTPKGRKVSPAGYKHMGYETFQDQQSLF